MADSRAYLVDPLTGKASIVADEDIDRAQAAGWTPASEQQRNALNLIVSARQDPLGGVKAFAEKAVSALPPVALAGLPSVIVGSGLVPSLTEIMEPKGSEAYEGARQEREKLARTLAKYTTPSGIAQTLGLTTAEDIRAREEEYPVASTLGTIAGALSPTIAGAVAKRLPGAIGTAAKASGALAADEALASAAIEAGNIEGITLAQRAVQAAPGVMRLEEAARKSPVARLIETSSGREIYDVTEKAARRVADILPGLSNASPVAKQIVAKAVALPVGSAVEGALYTTGQIADETALGRQDIAAEKILSEITEGALLSGGIAGAIGLGGAGAYGLMKGARAGTAKLRDVLLDRFPGFASFVTDADVDDLRLAVQKRELIKERGLRDLLDERLGRLPEPPKMADVGPAPTFEKPALRETMPVPERPGMRPTMPAPSQEPLKASEANRVARELSDALEARRQVVEPMEKWANAEARKIETAKIIRMRTARQTKELEEQFLESLAGRRPTFAEDIALEEIRSGVAAARPYREAADELLATVRQVAGKMDEPLGYPDVVRRSMGDLTERLESFLAKNPSPEKIHAKLKKLKAEIFDKPAGATREEMAKVSSLKKDAANEFGRLYGRFVDFLSDEDLWGYAGKREAEFNRMLTERDPVKRRHLGDFFKKVPAPGGKTVYEVDRKKVLDAVQRLKFDPLTGAPDEKSIRWFNNLNDILSSDGRLIDEVEKTARYAEQNFNKEMLSEALGQAKGAISSVVDDALLRASNRVKEAEFKALKAEASSDLKNAYRELAAANTKYRQIKDTATADAKMAKQELRQEIERQKSIISDYKKKTVQAKEDFAAAREEYKALVAQRGADLDERMALLGEGAKSGGLSDALKLAASGAAFGYYVNPIAGLIGSAAAGAITLASNPQKTLKTLAQLERLINKTNARIDAGVASLVGVKTGAATTLPAATVSGSMREERTRFEGAVGTVTRLARDEDELSAHLYESTGALSHDAPGVSQNADAVTSRAVSYLSSKVPTAPVGLPPMAAANWKPSDTQVRTFNRVYRSVDAPLSILADANKGTLMRDQVEAVSVVYPELMNEIRTRILDGLEENPNISAPRRRVISMLLGIDIDGQSGPGLGVMAQSVYGGVPAPMPVPAQAPQQQLKAFQGKALKTDSRAARETTEWRKAQDGVGSWNRIGRRTQ